MPKLRIMLEQDLPDVRSFKYTHPVKDPAPRVLVFGIWTHPSTGNDLLCGLNLNWIPGEPSVLKQGEGLAKSENTAMSMLESLILPKPYGIGLFDTHTSTYDRYWAVRKAWEDLMELNPRLPDIFADYKKGGAYATWRRDRCVGATPDFIWEFDPRIEEEYQKLKDMVAPEIITPPEIQNKTGSIKRDEKTSVDSDYQEAEKDRYEKNREGDFPEAIRSDIEPPYNPYEELDEELEDPEELDEAEPEEMAGTEELRKMLNIRKPEVMEPTEPPVELPTQERQPPQPYTGVQAPPQQPTSVGRRHGIFRGVGDVYRRFKGQLGRMFSRLKDKFK